MNKDLKKIRKMCALYLVHWEECVGIDMKSVRYLEGCRTACSITLTEIETADILYGESKEVLCALYDAILARWCYEFRRKTGNVNATAYSLGLRKSYEKILGKTSMIKIRCGIASPAEKEAEERVEKKNV